MAIAKLFFSTQGKILNRFKNRNIVKKNIGEEFMDMNNIFQRYNPTIKSVLNHHLEVIKKAIDEGHSKKTIYNSFKEQGLIKNDYIYFVRTLKKLLSVENKREQKLAKKGFEMKTIPDEDLQ